MANEGTIDAIATTDQPSLHNVTALPKRDTDVNPLDSESLHKCGV
jgi:hypothetical protein